MMMSGGPSKYIKHTFKALVVSYRKKILHIIWTLTACVYQQDYNYSVATAKHYTIKEVNDVCAEVKTHW